MRSARDTRRIQGLVIVALLVLVAYLLMERQVISSSTLLLFAVMIPSIILHEVAHGAVALAFGDDTARRAGRLTLNPISHIDPFGTIILPALLAVSGAGAFGWARPVPVDPARLRSPRNHWLIVSLAGPAVNMALAGVAALGFHIAYPHYALVAPGSSPPLLLEALYLLGFANVTLAVLNLLPIPPLDGSAVLERLLPRSWWPGYLRFRQYSMLLLLAVFLLLPPVRNHVFSAAQTLWGHILGQP